jgi:very-short-patch-repair endonuclease
MGGKNIKREPDFLVCQDGKWGILEVMGEDFHPRAADDHDRASLFEDYGLYFIKFYDAKKCREKPNEVVEDFLRRLAKAKI